MHSLVASCHCYSWTANDAYTGIKFMWNLAIMTHHAICPVLCQWPGNVKLVGIMTHNRKVWFDKSDHVSCYAPTSFQKIKQHQQIVVTTTNKSSNMRIRHTIDIWAVEVTMVILDICYFNTKQVYHRKRHNDDVMIDMGIKVIC